jgi:hypothetical protein
VVADWIFGQRLSILPKITFAGTTMKVFDQRQLHGTVTIRPKLKIDNQKVTQK